MITVKTVLVLGAGASAPYGFPLGSKLVRDMWGWAGWSTSDNWCKSFLEFLQIEAVEEITSSGNLVRDMKSLCNELIESRPHSIDEFLERRPDMEVVGRLLISICLLLSEQKSETQLWNDTTDGHWYDYLKAKLINSPERLGQDQLRVITFNYERSLEYFLYRSLKPYYNYSQTMTDDAYTTALKQFQVLHVYGSLGSLPWQSATDVVPYGAPNYKEILAATNSIKVLHQGVQDAVQQNFRIAQEWLKWAEKIVFLGFGFHPDNVDRLALREILREKEGVIATCLRLDATSKQRGESCVHHSSPIRIGHPPVSTLFPDPNADCYTLLHDHVVLA